MKKDLGVLLHVSSLESEYGIGDFGKSSFDFIDFLAQNNIGIWQILPLMETNEYNCPYSCLCYFSFDTMFVSPDDLVERKLVAPKELEKLKTFKNTKKVQYTEIKKEKLRLLNLAYSRADKALLKSVEKEMQKDPKLKEYAIFKALTNVYGENWRDIPFETNEKDSNYLGFLHEHKQDILKFAFFQYILSQQWQKVLEYANSKGVKIWGDLPVYPNKNSFDVFANPECYLLDQNKNPTVVGGVPPDNASDHGQCWCTCVYDWQKLEKTNYKYMIDKIKTNLKFYNTMRIDHFIGYVEHWEIKVADSTTCKGSWQKSGGAKFFAELSKYINLKNLIVEDLGMLSKQTKQVRDTFELKGMNILQYANDSRSPYLPQNVKENSVYYLGTHDNNTFIGFLDGLDENARAKYLSTLGLKGKNNEQICIEAIKQMLSSKCDTIILQMQDYLMQPATERMNVPGQAADCWRYRVPSNYKKTFLKNLAKILEK